MDLTKHKETQKICEEKAKYFTNMDFPVIAEIFSRAAESLADLICVLDKLNEITVESEERSNE